MYLEIFFPQNLFSKNIFKKFLKFFKIFFDNIFQKNYEIQIHKLNFAEKF